MPVANIKAVCAAFVVASFLAPLQFSQAQQGQPEPMSIKQSEQFALAAVSSRAKRLPAFQFDTPQKNSDGLYVFNAIWQGLPEGSVEIGFYVVDPLTGTVWNGVAECQQISTQPLRVLQQKRLKELGITAIQLRKFELKGPQCS
jgi:hypothetical protein